jgi:hypothetical protein
LAEQIASRIAGRCHLSQALDVVQDIALTGRDDFPFLDPLLEMLAASLDSIPLHAFRDLEMAPAISRVFQRADSSTDPPAVIEWLHLMFFEFVKTRAFEPDILMILNSLEFAAPTSAFVAWCYSCVLEAFDGDVHFLRCFPEFKLSRIELCFPLPLDKISWLLDHLEIATNHQKILEMICGWIQANVGQGQMILFGDAISRQLFVFPMLSGVELDTLLPLAHRFEDPSIFDAIVLELKSDFGKWRNAIECKAPRDLFCLSWTRMLMVYDLQTPPRPHNHASTIVNEMRLAAPRMDSRFYHWILANRVIVTLEIIIAYLGLVSTDLSHGKKPYRRLVIIDILNQMENEKAVRPLKVRVIKEFEAKADFAKLVNILTMKKIPVCLRTLEQLKRHCRPPSMTAEFVRLLQQSLDPEVAIHLVMPVSELSIETCIEIASAVRECPIAVMDSIAPMVRLVLGTLRTEVLCHVPALINFD